MTYEAAVQREMNEMAERSADLLEALKFYANPNVYKAHPHGLAFGDRDLSFVARAAIAKAKALAVATEEQGAGRRPEHAPDLQEAVEAARRIVSAADGMNGSRGAYRRAAAVRFSAAMADEYGVIKIARALFSLATEVETAIAEERERCAKVADKHAAKAAIHDIQNRWWEAAAEKIAEEIRSLPAGKP